MAEYTYDLEIKQGSDFQILVNVGEPADLTGATISGRISKKDIANTTIADLTCAHISGSIFTVSLPASSTSLLISDQESQKPTQSVFDIGFYNVKVVPVSGSVFYPLSGNVSKIKSNI